MLVHNIAEIEKEDLEFPVLCHSMEGIFNIWWHPLILVILYTLFSWQPLILVILHTLFSCVKMFNLAAMLGF